MVQSESFSIISIIVAIIGAVMGAVSLAITIYKARKERPKLSFTVEDCSLAPSTPKESPHTLFWVTLRIDNTGDRSTTIYKFVLYVRHDNKTYSTLGGSKAETIPIIPHETSKQYLLFQLEDVRIEHDVKGCTLEILYTHDKTRLFIPIIRSR